MVCLDGGYKLIGCDSFGSTEYDIRIINDKSTTVVLTAKNVLDGIGL
ncbi:3-oxoacyl-[acyl-carrier protein] reductase [Richelia intracellularis]|nr:3-oxoacyl-[acyl-carrier protein] reductase [Richelia intracellularis]